jgi:hypothetical protein
MLELWESHGGPGVCLTPLAAARLGLELEAPNDGVDARWVRAGRSRPERAGPVGAPVGNRCLRPDPPGVTFD